MSVRRLLATCAVAAALGSGAGCGTVVAPGPADSATTASPTPLGATVAHLSLDQLRRTVLDAVRATTTVHLAIGNLNPPPVVQVVEDYSRPGGDLEATFAVGSEGPPDVVGRRVDGEVYVSVSGRPFERVPADKLAGSGGGALPALLRTDALEELTALLDAATTSTYDGPDPSVGRGAVRYRLTVDTARWFAAEGGGIPLGMPDRAGLQTSVPATLWVGSSGLPVRLEIRHSEPLDGVSGTGTSRIEYSHWGEPVSIARP